MISNHPPAPIIRRGDYPGLYYLIDEHGDTYELRFTGFHHDPLRIIPISWR